MKALFIGGTGTISMAITRALANDPAWELYLINRGNRSADLPENVTVITADINDEAHVAACLDGLYFDCVCDFIGFEPKQVERDFRLFNKKTAQFMYISSASAYNKPVRDYKITEGTSLANPYWAYSRNKRACEKFLLDKYEAEGFPVTIIRPSHTYDTRNVPLGVVGTKGSWQVIKRIKEGKPAIIHGDGTSLWTLTFNEDFAKGFIGLMGNPHAIGEAFQITSDESVTWNQIYEAIAETLGVKLKPCYVPSSLLASTGQFDYEGRLLGDKANSVVFDNTKLKKAVPGFTCTTRFDQGIRLAVTNILAHPELQREDPDFDAFCDKVIAAMDAAKAVLTEA